MVDVKAGPAVVPVAPLLGLRSKAGDLGLRAYVQAPAPVQSVLLDGFLKTQLIVAKVSPATRKLVGGVVGLALLGQLRRRGR